MSSFFIKFALPMATIKMSAFLVISLKFLVLECVIVTVASRLSKASAKGLPTILLLPIMTTFLPLISIFLYSNNFIIPYGVADINFSSLLAKYPKLDIPKPSTSFSGVI